MFFNLNVSILQFIANEFCDNHYEVLTLQKNVLNQEIHTTYLVRFVNHTKPVLIESVLIREPLYPLSGNTNMKRLAQ